MRSVMKHKSVTWIRLYPVLMALASLLLLNNCGTREKAESVEVGWPRWRGPNGDGISSETNWDPAALARGPKILWKVDIGMGYSNVAIKNNRLYTMGVRGKENRVFCLNAETGKEIWRYTFKGSNDPESTPTIEGENVYALSYEGILLCFKAKNGKVRWKRDLVKEFQTEIIPYGYSGSPVIEGDLIILNVNTAGIAVNKKTGDKIWASKVHTDKVNRDGYHATPAMYDHKGKRCALLFSGTGLFSVEAETGKQLWHHEWWPPYYTNCADPIFFENKVFISSGYVSDGCALLDITGNVPKVLWQNKNMRNQFRTSVYVYGYLYGSDGAAGNMLPFRCIDVKTGGVMWEKTMRMVSLITAGKKLILLEEDGTLYIAEANPSAYKEISRGNIVGGERYFVKFWTPPVLYKGKIYCRNYFRFLFCVDVSK